MITIYNVKVLVIDIKFSDQLSIIMKFAHTSKKKKKINYLIGSSNAWEMQMTLKLLLIFSKDTGEMQDS